MQTAQNTNPITSTAPAFTPGNVSGSHSTSSNPFSNYQIIRRNGAVVPFEPNKTRVIQEGCDYAKGIERRCSYRLRTVLM